MVMCTHIFLKLPPTHVLRARKYNKNITQDKSLLFINLLLTSIGAKTEHMYIHKRVIDGKALPILPKDFSRSCIFFINNGFTC